LNQRSLDKIIDKVYSKYTLILYFLYNNMRSAQINFKTKPEVKEKAAKLAEQIGLSLSSLLNAYLHHFLNTKSVYFSAVDEEELEPSDYLVASLKEADEARKRGDYYTFEDSDKAVKFLEDVRTGKVKV